MASRPNECDRNRLRLSLEDRLSEARQAELADHLEGCPDCRRELERMAAASKFWGEAALLRGEPDPGTSPTVGLADGVPEFQSEEEIGDVDAGWREFLDPPDPARRDAVGRLGPMRSSKSWAGAAWASCSRHATRARPDGGHQVADPRAVSRRHGPPPVCPRGPGRRRRRPRTYRRDSCRR